MKKKMGSISRIEDVGIKLFMGDVDEDKCEEAIKFILKANLNNTSEHLTLVINSSGGNCSDGFALIDFMAGSRIPIHTVGVGAIQSMGLLIFLAGKKGNRILTPNTLILSHQPSWGHYGKQHELVAAARANQIIIEQFMQHYRKYTGLDDEQIKKHLLPPTDVWMTADESLKLGICDEVRSF